MRTLGEEEIVEELKRFDRALVVAPYTAVLERRDARGRQRLVRGLALVAVLVFLAILTLAMLAVHQSVTPVPSMLP